MVLIVGLVLLGISVLLFIKKRRFLKKAIRTTGKVVDVKMHESTDTDTDGYTSTSRNYHPVLSFTDQNNNEITFEASVGSSNKKKYILGDTMEILYDPDKPEKATIDKFMHKWFFPTILLLVSLIIIISGIYAL